MSRVTRLVRRVAPGYRSSRRPQVEPAPRLYDVTSCAADIDLAALEVIRWTPAWLTRAERLLLYALIFAMRPMRYLEIGTFKGGSALIVATAMDALDHDGLLVCIDPDPQIDPEHWKRLKPRTTLLRGASPGILLQAYEIARGPFDFVFIDGDHSYAGVLRDANGVFPFLADGAHLLFHDSFFPPVAQAVHDFSAQHPDLIIDFGPLTCEVTLEPQPHGPPTRWGGLHLLQARRKRPS